MLGKDSKKNIQFPIQKQGTPSVVVLEDFFNEEFIREANNDFEEFIKKSSEVDFLSFGEILIFSFVGAFRVPPGWLKTSIFL